MKPQRLSWEIRIGNFLPTRILLTRRHQPNGVDKWGPGLKEMDAVEENYFNEDEEEGVASEPSPPEDITHQRIFELKRRRSLEDDVEDQLSRLSQKSLPQGTQAFSGVNQQKLFRTKLTEVQLL
jgi:hypothetical protein